jgi:hypothetical protein
MILIGIGGCSKRTELTKMSAFAGLIGRCVEIKQPVFLVRVAREDVRFEDISRYLIVRPGGLFASFSVAEYKDGTYTPDVGGTVIEVLEEGTQLQLSRAWRISSFEGAILLVTTEFVTEKDGEITADVGKLLDDVWRLDLADGKLSEFEQQELAGRGVLDERYASFCEASDKVPAE